MPTITKEEFDNLRKGDPLSDVPVDFPTAHTRFPLVPSDAFNDAIRNAQAWQPSETPPTSTNSGD